MLKGDLRESFEIVRTLQSGLEAVKKAPVALILGGFLYSLVQGGGGGSNVSIPSGDTEEEILIAGAAFLLGGCITLVTWVAGAFVRPGFYRAAKAALAETPGYDNTTFLFGGSDRFKDMLIWRLLLGLATLASLVPMFLVLAMVGLVVEASDFSADPMVLLLAVGALFLILLLIIPVFYVSIGLSLGDYYITFDECEPFEAMQKSWEATKGHRLHLLLYNFVIGFVSFVGIALCCVGVWGTIAIAETARVEAFLQFRYGAVNDDPELLEES